MCVCVCKCVYMLCVCVLIYICVLFGCECVVCVCVCVCVLNRCMCLSVPLYLCVAIIQLTRSRVYGRPGPDLDSYSQSANTPGYLKTDTQGDSKIRTSSYSADPMVIRTQNRVISCEYSLFTLVGISVLFHVSVFLSHFK